MKNNNKNKISSILINVMDRIINSKYLININNLEKYQNKDEDNRENYKYQLNTTDNIHSFNKNKSNFDIDKNKIEVLGLYRHMYKTIPTLENNYIRKRFLREEIKFYFQEGAREENINNILKYKNDAYIVIEKINAGVYPPFPQYKTL